MLLLLTIKDFESYLLSAEYDLGSLHRVSEFRQDGEGVARGEKK